MEGAILIVVNEKGSRIKTNLTSKEQVDLLLSVITKLQLDDLNDETEETK